MIVSKYAKTLIKDNRIMACNIRTGNYLRTNKNYFDLINGIIEKKGSLDLETIPANYVVENIKNLYKALLDIEFYVDTNKLQEENTLTMVFLAVTNRCNLKCIHCSASSDISNIDKLSTNEIKNIIRDLNDMKVKNINITGGEPLMREDIFEILDYMRSNYDGHITFSTNGLLINDKVADVLVRNVDEISISLDGYDESSCSKIRGKNVFERVMVAIKKLHDRNYTNISLSMLLTPNNIIEENKFKNLCKSLEVSPLIHRFTPSGRGAANITSLYTNKIYSRMDFDKARPKLCFPGEKEIFIDSVGKVFPCGNLLDYKNLIMGNIKLEKLTQILHRWKESNPLEEVRPWNINPCQNCNVNLFCHSCISNVINIKKNPEFFIEMCNIMRNGLSSAIWEN